MDRRRDIREGSLIRDSRRGLRSGQPEAIPDLPGPNRLDPDAPTTAAVDPIITIDAAGVIRSASSAVARVFGWRPEELLGRDVRTLVDAADLAPPDGSAPAFLVDLAERQGGRILELGAVRRSGERFRVAASLSRVDSPADGGPLVVAVFRDTTERDRHIRELRLLQDLGPAICDAPSLSAALADALDRICRATAWEYGEIWMPKPDDPATLACAAFWGAPGSGLETFSLAEPLSCAGPAECVIGTAWATGRPVWLSDLDASLPVDLCRAVLARELGLCAAAAIPVSVDDARVAVLMFFSRAVRPRDAHLVELLRTAAAPLGSLVQHKRTEQALRRSEAQLRAAFELAAVGQCQYDAADLAFQRVNAKLCEITAYSEPELLGLSLADLIHADDRAAARADLAAAARDLAPFARELRCLRRDRAVIWVHLMAAHIPDPAGGAPRGIAMIEDITDRRETDRRLSEHSAELERLVRERTDELGRSHEQLRMTDRLASIGTLAAGLGHDMNNVLLPVRAHLNALRSETRGLPPAARRHVEAIRKSAGYLQQLADGLHFLATDPKEGPRGREGTDLAAWWHRVGMLVTKAAPKGVEITARVPGGLPHVAAPPSGLTQAVLNLVVNAGEAMPADRRPRGSIRIEAKTSATDLVELSVTDNGVGMSEEVKRRAFEMFFTTKIRGLGTGLGLPLVRRVAAEAGGSVRIESVPGEGATVTMVLPAVSPDAARGQSGGPRPRSAVVSIGDGRSASLIAQLLSASGVRAALGESPAKATVWIVEPAPGRLARAKAWLTRHPEHRLLVVGRESESPSWSALSHARITDPTDFEAIRTALGSALAHT